MSLTTWTFQLLTSSCSPNFELYLKIHTQTHMHAHILCHWIERLAQQSCHCSFVFLLIDMPCKNAPARTHVHMHTERLYLSPLLNSITFTSFCSACPSLPFFFRRQLKELLWDFVKCLCERFSRPAAWRRFAHPPTNLPSCNVTVEKIHCACPWLYLSVLCMGGSV